MRKIWMMLWMLVTLAGAHAQTNTITFTVQDTSAVQWPYATWSIDLYNPSGGQRPININTGQPVTVHYSGTLPASALLSQAVTPNADIVPSGTAYTIKICPLATGAACQKLGPYKDTATAAEWLANLAPPVIQPAMTMYGYNIAEVALPALTYSIFYTIGAFNCQQFSPGGGYLSCSANLTAPGSNGQLLFNSNGKVSALNQITTSGNGILQLASEETSTFPVIDPRSPAYGAQCNWNGISGTDDTAAFQSAVNAAGLVYSSTGASVSVRVPSGCEIAGTVSIPSGVNLIGPGSIIVPNQSTPSPHPTLSIDDTSNVSISGITISVITPCSGNNATCAAISWLASATDTNVNSNILIDNTTIHNSDWGILILANNGSASLKNVSITNNLVDSPSGAYSNADGIHLGGSISNFTITHNRVSDRGDAGIALTSEVNNSVTYLCGGNGIVSDNVLSNDLVGLDNSGCQNVSWINNNVTSTLTGSGSNPAFRAIYYNALPIGVKVTGNTLQNGPSSTEYTLKIDPYDGSTGTSITTSLDIAVTNNFILTNTNASDCLYERGSGIEIDSNTFDSTCSWDVDIVNPFPNSNDIFGTNKWMGTGTINLPSSASLLNQTFLGYQKSIGAVTINNAANTYYPFSISPNFQFTPQLSNNPATWEQLVFNGGTTTLGNANFNPAGYQVQLIGTSATNAFNGHGAGGVELLGGNISSANASGGVYAGGLLMQAGSATCTSTMTCYGGAVSIQGGNATGGNANNYGSVSIQTVQGNVNIGSTNSTTTIAGITAVAALNVGSDAAIHAGPRSNISFSSGQLSGINDGGTLTSGKTSASETLTNIVATAYNFTCTTYPTFILVDCGTTSGSCSSPTTLASVTLTGANSLTPGTITSSSLLSGHYYAVETQSGVCTSLDAGGNIEFIMQ